MLLKSAVTALALVASVASPGATAQVVRLPEPSGRVTTGATVPDSIQRDSERVLGPGDAAADTLPKGVATGDLLFRMTTLGGPTEDWLRVRELRGGAALPALRSPSVLSGSAAADTLAPLSLALVVPELRYFWNSDLPFSFNDGPVWAGRGASAQAVFGFRASFGPAVLVVAPQFVYQQNRNFQYFPFPRGVGESRDQRSSPLYRVGETIDLPSRMGGGSSGALNPGQSSFRIVAGPLAFGAATENLWWGPAIRNAVVLSSNASGFPHLFVRSSRPLGTPFGDLEAQWILGRLRESRYFDDIGVNNFRAISGLAFAFRPTFEPDLTLGGTRVVYRVQSGRGFPLTAAFDALKSVGRPNQAPSKDLLREAGADQIFSLFARWVMPDAGFEAYGEWGRYEEPASLRDLFTAPHHSQGYTVGLQWVSAEPAVGSAIRVQAEATFLEPSASYRERRVISWYTSRPIPQGYTHLGQPLGAGVGPGASSQWAALDYLVGDDGSIGVFANRIRWDNGAFYASPANSLFDHDVSMLVGLRGSRVFAGFEVAAELYTGKRLNYLFQNDDQSFDDDRHIDVRNHSLRLSVTPRAGS